MDCKEALSFAEQMLEFLPSYKTDSLQLLSLATNKTRASLIANFELTPNEIQTFKVLIERRKNNEPMQKIIGYSEFLGLKVIFNKDTLTPRQETEILAEKVINDILEFEKSFKNKSGKNIEVLDLCAGSGCIGLSIAKHTNANVVLSDISDLAIMHIIQTKKINKVEAKVIKSNMFDGIKSKFDIIVSNPPYLKSCELENLEEEVRTYDPSIALDGGEDGLKFYKIIADNILAFLKPDGRLYLEIHYLLGKEIYELLKDKFKVVEILKDYSGLNRFILAHN